MYSWSVSFKFSFCGGKTRFTLAIAADKRASSHNFRMKSFNLLAINFLAIYLLSRGKSLYIINRRWERIIISARSFTDFQEKIVVTVLTTTSSVVFSKVHMCFFPWVGSSVRHSVPKFVGSLLNHLYRCANENGTAKPLSFNLIWLYFKYHFLAQKLSSLWKIFL